MFPIPLPEIWREMFGMLELSGVGSAGDAGMQVIYIRDRKS